MLSFGNITAHGQLYLHPAKPPANLVWTDPKGHTNYWCSVTGGTSGSSSSPRTESRETLPDSAVNHNWNIDDTTHQMSGTVRVELAPSSGKVIVGQIHAHNAPNPFLMVTWWNGVARVDLRAKPQDAAGKVLSMTCALSKSFKYLVKITPDRQLYVNLNGLEYTMPVGAEWDQYPFYFKAGSYVIDSEGPAEEGGWVVYEEFDVISA